LRAPDHDGHLFHLLGHSFQSDGRQRRTSMGLASVVRSPRTFGKRALLGHA
jgi:hypothetical protein